MREGKGLGERGMDHEREKMFRRDIIVFETENRFGGERYAI
jgi:hypothetical protein